MANAYLDLAEEVLRTLPKPSTYQEIWDAAKAVGLDKKLNSSGKTPWQSLGAQLYVDTRDNAESIFAKVGKRPARFFLKSRLGEVPRDEILSLDREDRRPVERRVPSYHERDLHPLLTYFAYANPAFNRGRSIYTKTIKHERSVKPGYSEWLYPDVVGFYLPLEDWRPDVIEFNRLSDNNSLRLFSFELKKSLDRGNYRESFFQAVSNSSWAHEGYLVTPHITEDDALLAELERLSSSFGIGIIQLDLSDFDSSIVLHPARPRDILDWETINKLCEQNTDFLRFLQDVKIDFESKRIHKSEYDDVIRDPEQYIAVRLGIK